MSGRQIIQQLVAQAILLRQQNPGQFGAPRARSGEQGYVKDGWRMAIQAAAQLYQLQTGKQQAMKSTRKPTLIPKGSMGRDYYNGYKEELRTLKIQYSNLTNYYIHPSKIKPKKGGQGTGVPRKLYAGQQPPQIVPCVSSVSSAPVYVNVPQEDVLMRESSSLAGKRARTPPPPFDNDL